MRWGLADVHDGCTQKDITVECIARFSGVLPYRRSRSLHFRRSRSLHVDTSRELYPKQTRVISPCLIGLLWLLGRSIVRRRYRDCEPNV